MAQLKENAVLRADVKRDILSKFSGSVIGKGYPRVFLEEEHGDFELVSAGQPNQQIIDGLKQGGIVTELYLKGRNGTWVFVEEV